MGFEHALEITPIFKIHFGWKKYIYFSTFLALGVLRQDEKRHPRVWKLLDVDPERKMVPLKENRGRTTGSTPITNWYVPDEKREIKPKRTNSVDRSSIFYRKARSGFKYWGGTTDRGTDILNNFVSRSLWVFELCCVYFY